MLDFLRYIFTDFQNVKLIKIQCFLLFAFVDEHAVSLCRHHHLVAFLLPGDTLVTLEPKGMRPPRSVTTP